MSGETQVPPKCRCIAYVPFTTVLDSHLKPNQMGKVVSLLLHCSNGVSLSLEQPTAGPKGKEQWKRSPQGHGHVVLDSTGRLAEVCYSVNSRGRGSTGSSDCDLLNQTEPSYCEVGTQPIFDYI